MPTATEAERTAKAMEWTCRLALAVAENDVEAIQGVVAECNEVPGGQPLLLTTMAGTLAAMMQETSGPNWREGMRATLRAVKGS